MSQHLDISVQIDCIYRESGERYEIWRIEDKEVEPGVIRPCWTERVSENIPADVVMDEVELYLNDTGLDRRDLEVLIVANEE